MEKILFVCNSSDFLTGPFEFACHMAKTTGSVLVGVILENLDWEEVPVAKRLPGGHAYIDYVVSTALPDNEIKREEAEDLTKRFADACIAREVKYKIHVDRNSPSGELLNEARYADLLIIDPSTSPVTDDDNIPTKFVTEILENSECPVIVAPETFDKIERIIFAYDGQPDTLHAIKQFTYLLPGYRNTRATVLEVLNKGKVTVTDKYKLQEWIGMHYSDVEIVTLYGKEGQELLEYLLPVKNAIVIMNGYSRGFISTLFNPSVSENLTKLLSLPVFISHHN